MLFLSIKSLWFKATTAYHQRFKPRSAHRPNSGAVGSGFRTPTAFDGVHDWYAPTLQGIESPCATYAELTPSWAGRPDVPPVAEFPDHRREGKGRTRSFPTSAPRTASGKIAQLWRAEQPLAAARTTVPSRACASGAAADGRSGGPATAVRHQTHRVPASRAPRRI